EVGEDRRLRVAEVADAGAVGDVLEAALAVVAEEEAFPGARDVEVGPAVAVVIGDRDAAEEDLPVVHVDAAADRGEDDVGPVGGGGGWRDGQRRWSRRRGRA